MTSFFIPGVGDRGSVIEDTYRQMCRQVEVEMGRPPSRRRILSLWTRRGSIDCVTEVGCRDPVREGVVVAIFDMGSRQPYVVWWQPDNRAQAGVREVLRDSAYTTVEFDR